MNIKNFFSSLFKKKKEEIKKSPPATNDKVRLRSQFSSKTFVLQPNCDALSLVKKEPTVKMSLGRLGENAALEYLEGLGYYLLERNFRHGESEIDIIMKDERCVVFCEVRTQNVDRINYLTPAESVTKEKRATLSQGAEYYMSCYSETLASNKLNTIPPCRFDVIEIYAKDNKVIEINHIKDAFFKTRKKKGTGRSTWKH